MTRARFFYFFFCCNMLKFPPSHICRAKPNVNRIDRIIPANQNKGYLLQSAIFLETFHFFMAVSDGPSDSDAVPASVFNTRKYTSGDAHPDVCLWARTCTCTCELTKNGTQTNSKNNFRMCWCLCVCGRLCTLVNSAVSARELGSLQ